MMSVSLVLGLALWAALCWNASGNCDYNKQCGGKTELLIICVKLTSIIDSTCVISSPNRIFYHLLESSR